MELIAFTIVGLGVIALLALMAWLDSDQHSSPKRAVADSDAQVLVECRDLVAALDTAARHGLMARTDAEREVEAASASLVIARGGSELSRLGHLITTLDRLADSGTED